jgi:hypothetical protein
MAKDVNFHSELSLATRMSRNGFDLCTVRCFYSTGAKAQFGQKLDGEIAICDGYTNSNCAAG